ncbi:MAG: hypothetical protein V4722_19410 [Bacteroidota bacterium]
MNLEDFEQFLKNQTDKHRMYPSDQIWRNINQQLHGNSRWPALTFAAILTGALLTAGLIFLHPDKDLFKLPPATTSAGNGTDQTIAANQNTLEKPQTVDITTLKPVDEKTVMYSFNHPVTEAADETDRSNGIVLQVIPAETISLNDPIKNDIAANTSINGVGTPEKGFQPATALLQSSSKISANLNDGNNISDDDVVTNTDSKLDDTNKANEEQNKVAEDGETDEQLFESNVVTRANPINKKKISNPFTVQVYGGSSISYRTLSEPDSYDDHFPYNSALTANPRKNVNNLVSQRASVGFEFGSALSYALSDRLKVRAGLQFNFRQYSINAFRAAPEAAVLLVANGNNNVAPDSVIVYSTIRNGDGFKPLTLQNKYYQLGLPVGIDWTVAEGRKVNFSLGATIQPTYQLNTDMYMLTSEYKSYVQQPDMVRRWNFNAGVEAMANFNAGGVKWQVGPQLRYQMLPTQSKSYSIREHLVDYGFKIGIIKQLK